MQQLTTDELFKKIHEIDQRLQYMERREAESLRHSQQTVQNISEQARTASTSIANLEIKLSKDIQFLEETLTREIQVEAQRRSESESRLRQQLLDEAVVVRSSLEKNERNRSGEVEQALQRLTSELSSLCSRFEQSMQNLDFRLNDAVSSAIHQATEAERKLQQHKATRETAEMHLLQILEETCVELHNEIIQERQERIESNKRLERLLLEMSSRQWVRT
jgi:hypothetical protein